MFANAKEALLLSEQVEGDTFRLTLHKPVKKRFLFWTWQRVEQEVLFLQAIPHSGDAAKLVQAFKVLESLPNRQEKQQAQITNVLNLAKQGNPKRRA
jgi:hypothetical protein